MPKCPVHSPVDVAAEASARDDFPQLVRGEQSIRRLRPGNYHRCRAVSADRSAQRCGARPPVRWALRETPHHCTGELLWQIRTKRTEIGRLAVEVLLQQR